MTTKTPERGPDTVAPSAATRYTLIVLAICLAAVALDIALDEMAAPPTNRTLATGLATGG